MDSETLGETGAPQNSSDPEQNTVDKPTQNEEPAPEKSELPFKKPTMLVGKLGKLPKKVQAVSPNKINDFNNPIPSPENKVTETGNNAEKPDLKSKMETTIEKPLEKPAATAAAPLPEAPALPYKEPKWSGLPESNGKPYTFEVLKNGSIIETIDLMKKPFWVFGRLPICDISMQHPTISRYHAVLQYREVPSEEDPPGFYIYDLGSTHGTFLNGKNNLLKPKMFAPVKVGHMLRLGCSQRSFILTGPEEDQEEESEFTVTQLKEMKQQKIKEHEERMRQAELEREEKRKKEEERGVDWGMGDEDDAEDEEPGENPFAATTNEELYLDDPKKALRGFFEREGLDLEYDCSEQGMGQFLCKVELPLDDEMGKPLIAEVLHRGKKKEAVVQCALEACRMLDRLGLLRQATHESKKRKAKNWEHNDYYDSDEDTFLDRTGTIEKKREKRMKVKEPEKAETYEGLLAKEKDISSQIAALEKKLGETQATQNSGSFTSNEEDTLDSYMKDLTDDKPDKQAISKMKLDLATLRKELAQVVKLANVAKPANMPALVVPSTSSGTAGATKKFNYPLFGKRKAVPVKFPAKPAETGTSSFESSQEVQVESEEEEEEDSIKLTFSSKKSESFSELSANNATSEQSDGNLSLDETASEEIRSISEYRPVRSEAMDDSSSEELEAPAIPILDGIDSDSSGEGIDEPMHVLCEFKPMKNFYCAGAFKRFESIMKNGLPAVANKYKSKLLKILRKLHRLTSHEERMELDYKTIAAKKRKVMKWILELRSSAAELTEPNGKLEHRVSTQLGRILDDLNAILNGKFKIVNQVRHMGDELQLISGEIEREIKELEEKCVEHKMKDEAKQLFDVESETPGSSETLRLMDDETPGTSGRSDGSQSLSENASEIRSDSEETPTETDERKKKKNQKRNEHRQHKAEQEKQKGYDEDASKENYNMWVPPTDQSGDGRTSLNEKFGY